MAQGITGFAGGRPAVQPIVRLASCLVPKERVHPQIEIASSDGTRTLTMPPAPPAVRAAAAAPPSALAGRSAATADASCARERSVR